METVESIAQAIEELAAARKRLINCCVMLRDEIGYSEFCRRSGLSPKKITISR